MSNSPLVSYTKLSPNHSGSRTYPISRITPHCVVGQCTIESLGVLFAKKERQGSSNYGIDKTGRVGMFVPEGKRAWTSGSADNDQRAVTIECASDTKAPYKMNPAVIRKLIDLCFDICARNKKNKLIWIPEKEDALAYTPATDEMLLTVHRWFQATACPGDWLMSYMGYLANEVNAELANMNNNKDVVYTVQTGAFNSYALAKSYAEKMKSDGYTQAYVTTKK